MSTSSSASSVSGASSMTDASGAQDYFSFQANFQPEFHIRDRAPRHTTITTRELRFPGGCDCHPSNGALVRRTIPIQNPYVSSAAQWRPHGRPEYIERHDSTDSRSSTNSESNNSSGFLASLFRRTSG